MSGETVFEEQKTEVFGAAQLRAFTVACLVTAGARPIDAEVTADVLLASDMRGIESHGVARLRRYVDGLRSGKIDANAEVRVLEERSASALLDANNGLGQPAAVKAMSFALDKAAATGSAAVGVRRSNHFGIAGYYADMATARSMIGIAMSNASPQVAPTFGAEPMFGTNPIGIGVPSAGQGPFVLDMATSTVPRGRLERMRAAGQGLPPGWAIAPDTSPALDIDATIEGLKAKSGYALLPLGGLGEEYGGHKGFGLGMFVDLMCGPLTGSSWGRHVYGERGADLGQFFVAIDPSAFGHVPTIVANVGRAMDEVRNAKRWPGADRIYLAGDKERQQADERSRDGIRLRPRVVNDLRRLSEEYGVEL